MEKKPKFTTRKGEMNGAYKVIGNEKLGTLFRITMQCSVCGFVVTRSSISFRRAKCLSQIATGKCVCAFWQSKGSVARASRPARVTDEQKEYSRMKTNFNQVLKRKLKNNPNLQHDDFDTILNTVGPKPPETDLYTWELGIKGRGKGKPDMTADNYEWRRLLKTGAVDKALAESNKSRTHLMRALRCKETLSDVTANDVMRRHLRAFGEEWQYFVGKKFGRFEIVDFRKEYITTGNVNYYFTAKCKCGHQFERLACMFYREKIRCPQCQRSCDKSVRQAKNSSTSSGSRLMQLRMLKTARKAKGIDIDSLMMLRESHSWYSLCFGTEDTMNFFIDCDLAGKGDDIRQIYWRG